MLLYSLLTRWNTYQQAVPYFNPYRRNDNTMYDIATNNVFHDLNPSQQYTGFILDSKKAAEDLNGQRLLIQSLLLSLPQNRADKRLQQLQHSQMHSWLKKMKHCSQEHCFIRLPDDPMEAFLPCLPSEFEHLSQFMSCSDTWLRERIQAVWDSTPELCCAMLISNECIFEAILRGLFSAAQQCGIESISILLPLVSRCREVQQQNIFTSACALDYTIFCDIGVEIATPRGIYFASELASYADVIVFNVDELCWLLYGKSQNTGNHTFGFHETPFNEFDDIGIGTLLGVAIQRIREQNPQIRLCASGKYVLTEKGKQFCQEIGIHSLIADCQQFCSY